MSRLILSLGMPRAGSGWHYNLIHDLVVAAGGRPSREIRRRYHLERVLTEVNCNIGHLRWYRLLPALAPALLGNTYTVKAHAGPTETARALIRLGLVRAAYIYRDPRAALLSAYEYGRRGLQQARPNAFSNLTTLAGAAEFIQAYVAISEAWLACRQVLPVRYESLLADYPAEAERLLRFLGLDGQEPAVRRVLDEYRPECGEAGRKGVHFSHGRAERFRQVFSPTEMEAFNRQFSAYLERMGYAP